MQGLWEEVANADAAAERARTALLLVDDTVRAMVIRAALVALFAVGIDSAFRLLERTTPPLLEAVFTLAELAAFVAGVGWVLVVFLRVALVVLVAARDVRDEVLNW